jgi:O-antigen/teichoic acid export membrane protein
MLKRLFKESLIYGLSRYISKFIGIFLLPLYTAVLTPEDYGILDLLNTIAIISSLLIVSGTDSALGYYYYRKEHFHERPEMISSALWLRLIFAVVVFIIIFFISPFISNLLFGRDYSLFVIIAGITIVFDSLFNFLFNLLRFEIRPWLFTIISSGGILLQILFTVYYILVLKKGVYGALAANAIAYGFFFIITIIYVFRRYGLKFSPLWFKKILGYGFPLIGTGIAVWILNSSDRYFLAHYADLSSVGIYSVGAKLAGFLGMIAGAFQLAWGPFATDIQYHDRAKEIYAKVFLIYFIINIIGVFLISMHSIDILKVFTQPSYYSAKAVVPFLCLSTIIWSGYFIVVVGIYLTKKMQHTIWITIGAAAANIVLNFILVPRLGVIGAAFSIMIANLIIFVLTLAVSQRYYEIQYSYKKVLYIFVPAALIVAVSYYYEFRLLPRLILTIIYLCFAVTYLYVNFKDTYEYRKIIERIGKLKSFKWSQAEETNIEV